MRHAILLLMLAVLTILGCSSPAVNTSVRVLTEDYPPLNYVDENGNLSGSCTEIVRAVMNKLGQKPDIEVMLWEKAFALAQKEPNVALYSTSRTPERENMFLWVGPLYSYSKYLYAKKGSGIKLNSLADVKNIKAIAGVRNDSGIEFCLKEGGKFIYSDNYYESLKKMMDGSADLWLGPWPDISYMARKAGINQNDIEPVLLVHKYDLYIAFNKNTPPAVIKQWQEALDSVRK